VDANPVAASSLVGDRARAVGRTLETLLPPHSPLLPLLRRGDEVRAGLHSETGRVLEVEVVTIRGRGSRRRGRLLVLRDVTEARAMEEALRESERLVRTLLDRSPDGILRVRHLPGSQDEPDSYLCLLANEAAERILGVPEGRLTGRSLDQVGIRSSGPLGALLQAVTSGEDTEREFALGRGREGRWVRATGVRMGQDLAVTLVDLTERREREEEMARAALRDSLTGLLNRRGFEEAAQKFFPGASSQRRAALLYLDLDRFKPVNDTLGHEAGDELLRRLAGRIRRIVRAGDLAARLGGDEFAILLPGVDRETTVRIAGRLQVEASRPYTLAGTEVTCPPSIGVALHPGDGADLRALLQAADRAMYAAKSSGVGTVMAGDAPLPAPSGPDPVDPPG
jgi:diguanylate cyclase (GGDEF)-like protein